MNYGWGAEVYETLKILFVVFLLFQARYISFESGFGLKIATGQADLQECEEYVHQQGEPEAISGQQEHCEAIFNRYL